MTIENIMTMLKTREEVARTNGNTTELSLLYELVKVVEEYKRLKEESKEG